jgi:hypothetical protein
MSGRRYSGSISPSSPVPSILLWPLALEEISCTNKLTSHNNLRVSAVVLSTLFFDPFRGQRNNFDRMAFFVLIIAGGERDILLFSVATLVDIFRNCLLAYAKR